jgi:hypothetical protein
MAEATTQHTTCAELADDQVETARLYLEYATEAKRRDDTHAQLDHLGRCLTHLVRAAAYVAAEDEVTP